MSRSNPRPLLVGAIFKDPLHVVHKISFSLSPPLPPSISPSHSPLQFPLTRSFDHMFDEGVEEDLRRICKQCMCLIQGVS